MILGHFDLLFENVEDDETSKIDEYTTLYEEAYAICETFSDEEKEFIVALVKEHGKGTLELLHPESDIYKLLEMESRGDALYETFSNNEKIKVRSLLKEKLEIINESKDLCSGIFWILSDDYDLGYYEFLGFEIPCDENGNPEGRHKYNLNAKNGLTYNHKKIWEEEIKNNSKYKPFNKKSFDYYPRGRVSISRGRADIFLNPHLNQEKIIREIKQFFGLIPRNISKVNIIEDGSSHYKCFIDRWWKKKVG